MRFVSATLAETSPPFSLTTISTAAGSASAPPAAAPPAATPPLLPAAASAGAATGSPVSSLLPRRSGSASLLVNLPPLLPPADVLGRQLVLFGRVDQRALGQLRKVGLGLQVRVVLDAVAAVRRRAPVDHVRGDLLGRLAAERADDLERRVHRRLLVVGDPQRLRAHVEARLEVRLLGGDARRAVVRVALERLDAAEREHHRARRVAQVGARRQHAHERKARVHLARDDELDLVAQVAADEHRVDEPQPVARRHAETVLELGRRRAGPTLAAIDGDEVGDGAAVDHRVAERRKLLGSADAHLEADGFAARELAQLRDELHEPRRRGEGAVAGRRVAVGPRRRAQAASVSDDGRDLVGGKDAAVRRLGALRELDLDHLDLRPRRVLCEELRIKLALPLEGRRLHVLAASEVARADVPHDVGAEQVVLADAALTGIVVEAPLLGAEVERRDSAARERAVRHRGDVEQRGRVGLLAGRAADQHPRLVEVAHRLRKHRVARPLVARGVDVAPRAQRVRVCADLHLRARVDCVAHRARVRDHLLLVLDEVLLDLGPDALEQVAEVDHHREVAPQRVRLLPDVLKPQRPVARRRASQ
mmetsp:Transcript_3185/g.11340  ORF Transcript_3185/g.11340 Transcript_3185/m.11340 type:complete len:591 (+) Transcript_3185:387-2159(+)